MECILLWLATLSMTSLTLVGSHREHKVPYVHNIVLYPDKHSWCKTTEIKQIVAYPGCSSVEIDNNVCVGACFSYSIPRTLPSAPGEVITPYCDSCQPTDTTWKQVTLTCSDDSEEEGTIEMTKQVQVITNCSCSSCNKQYESYKTHDHGHNHTPLGDLREDVPELIGLMMEIENTKIQPRNVTRKLSSAEEKKRIEAAVKVLLYKKKLLEDDSKNEEKIELQDELNGSSQSEVGSAVSLPQEESEEEEEEEEDKINDEEKPKGLTKEEKLKLEKKENIELGLLKPKKASEENKEHYIIGPHHSLIIKPDIDQLTNSRRHHKLADDDELVPSLSENQFKLDDIDQLSVESEKKEILELPEILYRYNNSNKAVDDKTKDVDIVKWSNGGELMVDVDHHQLKPAQEGVELSYIVKNKSD